MGGTNDQPFSATISLPNAVCSELPPNFAIKINPFTGPSYLTLTRRSNTIGYLSTTLRESILEPKIWSIDCATNVLSAVLVRQGGPVTFIANSPQNPGGFDYSTNSSETLGGTAFPFVFFPFADRNAQLANENPGVGAY